MPTKKTTSTKARRKVEGAEDVLKEMHDKIMIDQFKETWSRLSLKGRAEIELVIAAGAAIGQFMIAIYAALVQLKKGRVPSVEMNMDLLTDAACTYADLRPTKTAKTKKRKTAKKPR